MAEWRYNRSSSNAQKTSTYKNRYYLIIAILVLGVALLIWRLVDLTVFNRNFLQDQGNARTLRTMPIPAYRGMILDRNGEPLAISTPVASIWVNPEEFSATKEQFAKLAELLNLPKSVLREKTQPVGDKEFVYLKRSLDPEVATVIKNLGIPGIYAQNEFRRYYPEADVAAHLLGFTNVDDHGQEGLELAYDQWLQGVPGERRVIKDRRGHVVADVDVLKQPRPGHNLVLSIDHRIQYFAYHELMDGVAKYKADSGSAIVVDINTGEILAIANWPSYNPNNRSGPHDGRYRNRAVTDLFEPGSTIKSFSMVAALASGKYHPESTIDTSPGYFYVNGNKIEDEHNNGVIDLAGILKLSSNVGMSKIVLTLKPEDWWNNMRALGFGQLTNSNFPGEREGYLPNYTVWNPFVLCTMSWGYGLSVTLLQLAQGYTAVAADGMKRPMSLLKVDAPPAGTRVMDSKVASELRTMLETVLVKGGTAPLARVPGYRVTGKTGTARIAIAGGYEKHRYNSFFVGIAPASNPRLVVAVVLHDPQGTQFLGGYTSGPIFSKIMGESLRLLNVPPDDLNSAATVVNEDDVKPPPAGMPD